MGGRDGEREGWREGRKEGGKEGGRELSPPGEEDRGRGQENRITRGEESTTTHLLSQVCHVSQ